MKKTIVYMFCMMVMAVGAVTLTSAYAEDLLPHNAVTGECYARVFVPATYNTVSETTLKKEASQRLLVQKPKFEFVEETVMTKAPSERLEIVPATYEWVDAEGLSSFGSSGMENAPGGKGQAYTEGSGMGSSPGVKLEINHATYEWVEDQVMAYPEYVEYEEVPAVYETVKEKVLDQPAHNVWKKGKGPIQKINDATGEIMCLVKVPATYKTITKRILVKPATTSEITIPAQYMTVKKQIVKTPATIRKQILKTPATVRRIEIPAEYKTVRVRKLAAPAQIQSVAIPEEFQTVSKREMLSEGKMEWRSILCDTNVSPDIISSLQSALKDAGYNPGSIDGTLGSSTMKAIHAFQVDKGLPHGELTLETLKSLNVDF